MIYYDNQKKLSRIKAVESYAIMIYDINNIYQSFILIQEEPFDKILINDVVFKLEKMKGKNTFKAIYKEAALPQIIEINKILNNKLTNVKKERK